MTDLYSGGAGRLTLGSGVAQLRVAGVARQTLMSSLTAATTLRAGGLVRETFGSGTALLKAGGAARQVLMSSTIASGRRRQLINPM